MMLSVSVPGKHEIRDHFAGSTKRDSFVPLHSGHVMQAGSNTKSFVAAMLLKLIHDTKKVSLDDKLSQFVSDYP